MKKLNTYLIKAWVLVLIAIASPSLVTAQNNIWDLKMCIDHAVKNNIQIKIGELTISDAEQNLLLSRHARNPNLNASASQNYNWGRSFDVFTNAPVTERVQSNGFSLGSSVTLFNGFQQKNTIKQNELNLEASKQDNEKVRNDIVLTLAGAYLQTLLNKEILENSVRQVANIQEQITRTQRLVDLGAQSISSLLDLKSQKASADAQVIQAENTLNLSLLQIKQILQIDGNETFDIVVPDNTSPDTKVLATRISEIYETALGLQPQIKSAALSIESSDIGVEIAKGAYMPTLSLSGGVSTAYSSAQADRFLGRDGTVETAIAYVKDYPNNGDIIPVYTLVSDPSGAPIIEKFAFSEQLKESFNRRVSLSLSIPIYNRNQIKSSVARAMIQKQRATLQEQRVKNDLRQSIEQAYFDAIAGQKTFQANTIRVEALTETYRVTKTQFEQNVATNTDFNISLNNLNSAKSDLIQSKYSLIFRIKVLEFYTGNVIGF